MDRTMAYVALKCSCAKSPDLVANSAKHARCVYMLGALMQVALLLPLGVLIGWGAMTISIPGADVVGVAVLLLFSAFFLFLWTTAAWSYHGFAFNFGGSPRRIVPIGWGASVFLVVAFNGLAVFLDNSFSFISVSWFFVSLNMVPIIFISHWHEPGAHEGSSIWRRSGSISAIRQQEANAGDEAKRDEERASNNDESTGAETVADGNGGGLPSANGNTGADSDHLLRSTLLMYLLSMIVLAAYVVAVLILPSYRCADFGGVGAYTGLVTAAAFLVIDLVTTILHRSNLLTNPILINLVLLFSRGCVISFGAQLWYVGHAAMLMVYGLVIGTICVHYRLRSQKNAEERAHTRITGTNSKGKASEGKKNDNVASPALSVATPSRTLTGLSQNPMLALFVMAAVAIPELVMVGTVYNQNLQKVIIIDGTAHDQYEFGCGALFVVAAWTTFYWWFCVARRESKVTGDRDLFTFNFEGNVLLGAQAVLFLGGGVGLFIVTSSYIILFSSIFVPVMVISGMLLYGRWRANDFRWLQKRSLRKNTRKMTNTSGEDPEAGREEKNDEGKDDEGKDSSNAANDPITPGRIHDEKTPEEIEDQSLDSDSYRVGLLCDPKNADNADNLCSDGCGKCCSHWGKGDFRRTHCCIACLRGGLTKTDYYTIAGMFTLFSTTVLWGMMIFAAEPDTWVRIREANRNATLEANLTNSTASLQSFRPDSKRIGPVLSMVTLTLIFTITPIVEHFQTLRPIASLANPYMLVELVVAGLLHSGLHVYVWQIWQDGVVNTNSLATLLSFLLYPSVVMLSIGLYKWRDDKWLRGSHYKKDAAMAVGTYIGVSQLLLLAFDILVGLVYDWFIAIILLFLHASGLTIMAALAVWVLHGFYLPKVWKRIVGALFALVIAGGIAGAVIGEGTDAFLSFSASWCALLSVFLCAAFSTLYPKLKRGDLYFAETVLPAYEWKKTAGRIVPYRLGVVALYVAYFMALSWGAAATLFLSQPYIGMSCSSFTLVLATITTAFLSHHGRSQFSSAIAKIEASSYLVLDEDISNSGSVTSSASNAVKMSLAEALEKAHGMFRSAGAVVSVEDGSVEADGEGKDKEMASSTAGNSTSSKGIFSIKRYSSLPPPSTKCQVLTERVLREAKSSYGSKSHPTAEDISEDIRCIEAAVAKHFSSVCCGIKNVSSKGQSKSGEGDLEMAATEEARNSQDVSVEDMPAESNEPMRYDEAPLSMLLSTLITLDYDYAVTMAHENDVAAAFRNYVSKIANAQVANSEARFQGFLDWARLPDQVGTLEDHNLLDVFGQPAQVRASRSTRGGGKSPISLTKVFTWRHSKPSRFRDFQQLLVVYQEYEREKKAEQARREKESADAERERQRRLHEAEERRRAAEAEEYRRKHAAEAKEMEDRRKREIEERRRKARQEQERRREELRQRREKEQKEEEERRRKEEEETREDEERRAQIEARREARRKKMERDRQERERKNAEKEREEAETLRKEEERQRRDEDDAIIHRLRAQENDKFMTDELYTDKSLQRELAATKLTPESPSGKKFVDKEWSGDKAMLIDPGSRNSSVAVALLGRQGEGGRKWMRPEEFCRGGQPALVHRDAAGREGGSGFDPSDVCQGSLGDCWFLSAMAVVASHPSLMEKVFVTRETNKEGFYIVRIFKHGEWHNVVVDDKLLVLDQRGYEKQPICVKSKSGHELWMSILEKAYSKFHGSYEAINGGQVHVGLADLTGGIADSISLEKKRAEIASGELFHEVKGYFDSGYLMGAGSPAGSDTDVSELGIVQGHAYSILNIVEESDSNGNHQLIKLRNPWGATEWKGDWSDRDQSNWTSRMRQRLGYDADQVDVDDGAFWMSWQDFCRNYSTISLCRMFQLVGDGGQWHRAVMQAEWKGKTAGGLPSPQNSNTQYNPQFLLKLSRPGHVFIQLEQTKPGHVPGRPAKKKSIAAFVLQNGGKRIGSGIYGGMIKNTAPYINSDMVTMEIGNLRPDPDGYTILCTTYKVRFYFNRVFVCLFVRACVCVCVCVCALPFYYSLGHVF